MSVPSLFLFIHPSQSIPLISVAMGHLMAVAMDQEPLTGGYTVPHLILLYTAQVMEEDWADTGTDIENVPTN